MSPDERAWLDALLAEVKPVSPEEAAILKATWEKWAYFSAHDEDTKDSFQGAEDIQIRLLVTLEQLQAAQEEAEKARQRALQDWSQFASF
jgi:hypothetical protein